MLEPPVHGSPGPPSGRMPPTQRWAVGVPVTAPISCVSGGAGGACQRLVLGVKDAVDDAVDDIVDGRWYDEKIDDEDCDVEKSDSQIVSQIVDEVYVDVDVDVDVDDW